MHSASQEVRSAAAHAPKVFGRPLRMPTDANKAVRLRPSQSTVLDTPAQVAVKWLH